MPLEREDLEFYLTPVQMGITEINAHLKELNGKTNKNITDIAILYDRAEQAKLLALETEANAKQLAQVAVEDAKITSRTTGSKWGAGFGTAVATTVIIVWQWWQNR